MDEVQRRNCEFLRSMESSEATEWLLNNYPTGGCIYIAKRSWKRDDQARLAEHFLNNIPHASPICYEALLSIMSTTRFVSIVAKLIPDEASDRELLEYYLVPALLKFAKTDKDQSAITYLKGELQH